MKLLIFILFALVMACFGCTSYSIETDDTLSRESASLATPTEDVEKPRNENNTPPDAIILFNCGLRWLADKRWENANPIVDWGISGIHPFSSSGFAFDWALLTMSGLDGGIGFDPVYYDTYYWDEWLAGLEVPLGIRYRFEVTDTFRPFVRGGIVLQAIRDDYLELWDSGLPVISYRASGLSAGAELGGGLSLDFGKFNMEMGIGFSLLKTNLTYDSAYFRPVGPYDYYRDSLRELNTGSEPRIYLAMGFEF